MVLSVVVAAALSGQSRPTTMEEMHKLHQDSKAYIAVLEDPARDAYQKPHEVVMALGLKEGSRGTPARPGVSMPSTSARR
jgi:hypothetical protein